MKIKSRKRRIFKLSLFTSVAVVFFIRWIIKNDFDNLIFSAIFLFIPLIQIIIYSQTILELTKNNLIVKRKGLIKENYEIELKNIRTTFYEEKKYDFWELYQRFFIEIFFPSGQSFLIVNLIDGDQKKIPFDGNLNDILNLMKKLPERLPN